MRIAVPQVQTGGERLESQQKEEKRTPREKKPLK